MDLSSIIPYGNWLAIPWCYLTGATSGVLNTGSRTRRRLAFMVAMLAVVAPFMVEPDLYLLRFVASLGIVLALFRSLDLYKDDRSWSAARRAWLMIAIYDARNVRFGQPFFDWMSWLRLVGFSLPTAVGLYYSLTINPNSGELAALLLRWGAGALTCYCFVEMVVALFNGGHALAGVTLPPIHRDPILSRTVSEFWGRRWNLVVHEMLRAHLFRPLARQGHVRLGTLAAFCASAAIHFWIIFVPLGLLWALCMSAFFLLQGVLMLIERPLGVGRWRRALAHAWTVVCVLGTSPLFTEPMIQLLPTRYMH